MKFKAFTPDERLFRGVHSPSKRPNLWEREDGRISSAAFKSSNGVSVIRESNQLETNIITRLCSVLNVEFVFTITYDDCLSVDACVIPSPSSISSFHCDIWRDENKRDLSQRQARVLSKIAKLAHPKVKYPLDTDVYIF